ncbi:MAG: MerR family transcriptional regulator [Oscillospiraceae bacterium]|nr:MerR family transcriptional regulator [Oscillospiraceae bacterium]
MEYTVNKLSKLSGVSARTLRYYDEIGLLKPAKVASSGYRSYGQYEVDMLQQILFYRELNFSLDDIQKIMTDPNFDREQAFTNHLTELQNKSVRLDELIVNVKKSMAAMKGEGTMSVKEKFKGFSKTNRNVDAVLKEISITGNVAGGLLLNEIEQVFVNIGEENVEFIYTFPMPEDASVTSFSAMIGDERFTGVVQEKEEALEKYQKAIVKGDSAYMLESHRDNIFQASLGNVAKGETVTVHISYIQDVTVSNNEIRLLIPTLVSPRYIPGKPIGPKTGMGSVNPTGQVPDADFITPVIGETGYKVDFNLSFELDNNIKEISSPSHDITSTFDEGK